MADILDKQPDHWLNNPHLYSLEELMQVKSGEMINHLKPLVTQSLVHITQCEVST